MALQIVSVSELCQKAIGRELKDARKGVRTHMFSAVRTSSVVPGLFLLHSRR